MPNLGMPGSHIDCSDQPYAILSRYAPCQEHPRCETIYCFDDVRCLLSHSTAPIVAGCRSSLGSDLYCVCPENPEPSEPFLKTILSKLHAMSSQGTDTAVVTTAVTSPTTTVSTITTTVAKIISTTPKSGGLSGGAIAGIVIGVLAFLFLCAIGVFFALRYVRDRRKNHGEYRPQWEEEHHAKDLPHLNPPAIEGLI